MDSLFPFLQGLAPLQHVGLSRRTAYHRPRFPYLISGVFDCFPLQVLEIAGGFGSGKTMLAAELPPMLGGRGGRWADWPADFSVTCELFDTPFS